MIYAVVLRPLDVVEANRLVNLYHSPLTGGAGASLPTMGFSRPDYEDLRAHQTSFSGLSAWSRFREVVVAEGFGAIVTGEMVGGDYFPMLGVVPLRGRLIRPNDDRHMAALAIVPVLFVASALVACYLPARRAARVDPNVALRHL